MAKKTTIAVTAGEDRRDVRRIKRFYAFGVSQTGLQIGLKEFKDLSRTTSRTIAGNPFEYCKHREYEIEYVLAKDSTVIKLVNIITVMGNRPTSIEIFVIVSDNSPEIILQGIDGFGQFKGRGTIDYERSSSALASLIENKKIYYAVTGMPVRPSDVVPIGDVASVAHNIIIKRGGKKK